MKKFLMGAVVLLPVVLWAATGEKPVSYSNDLEQLVVKRCGDCHSTQDPKAKLVLTTGDGFKNLVNRASAQAPEVQLVTPGDPMGSYVWLKLMGKTEIGKGMPRTLFGSKSLPEDELDLFRRWIEDGAKP